MSAESARGDRLAPADDVYAPLPVVIVGAGRRGRHWIEVVRDSPLAELVGVVDVDEQVARSAVAELGVPAVVTGADLGSMLAGGPADAVIDVTIPAAHHLVARTALLAGLPVLTEKPLASTLPDGLRMAAMSDSTGQLLMVAQTRRYSREMFILREQTRALGSVGVAQADVHRAFDDRGGFRATMDHPVLLDLGVHACDTARFILESEPVAVFCEEFNPSWSNLRGSAVTVAVFEMTDGARFTYTGNGAARGHFTSWNGSWLISGREGSISWDGQSTPALDPDDLPSGEPGRLPGIGSPGILTDFVTALRTGAPPMCEVHDNVMTLAMVAAAIESVRVGAPVVIADVLTTAHEQALAEEDDAQVRAALAERVRTSVELASAR